MPSGRTRSSDLLETFEEQKDELICYIYIYFTFSHLIVIHLNIYKQMFSYYTNNVFIQEYLSFRKPYRYNIKWFFHCKWYEKLMS